MWVLFLFLLPLATGAATVFIVSRTEGTRLEIRGLVGPFFVSVSFIFGLLVSLVTSDVWQSISRANLLVSQEAAALRAVLHLADADRTGEATKRVRPLVDAFVRFELTHKNADLLSHGDDVRQLEEASRGLHQFVGDPSSFGGDSVLRSNMISKLEAVREMRFQRLAVTTDRVASAKLALLFVTGFLTQIAICMVHAGNLRPMIAAMSLFSLSFGVFVVALDFFQSHTANIGLVSWRALELAVQ